MKKIFVLLALLSTAIFANEMNWEKDIATAFAKAKESNQTVMVYVETNNCPWCRKMKHRTLANDPVFEKLKNYVVVRTIKNSHEAQKYGLNVTYVPTIFFFSPQEKLHIKTVGYYGVEDFLSWLGDVEKKASK
jgi:thioredoxin-related protein